MNARMMVVAVSCAMNAVLFADEVSYPLESGDISLEENWNGELPGVSDTVKLDGNGPYSASKNMEVQALIAHSQSPKLTIAEGVKISIMNASGKDGLEFRANSVVDANITGGIFHMVNGANCEVLFGRYDGDATPGASAVLSSLMITNANYFIAARRFSDATLDVTGNSRIYSNYGKISQWDSAVGYGNALKLTAGSEWHVKNHLYFESVSATAASDKVSGGSQLYVEGDDSVATVGGQMIMGEYGISNRLQVADCASFKLNGSFCIGGAEAQTIGLGGHAIVFSNAATGTFNTVYLAMRRDGGNNTFTVASNSFVSVATMTIGNQASGNTLVVDDAMLDVRSQLHIGSSKNTEGTENTVILRGRNPQLCNRNGSTQWIYAFNRSKFRFEVPEGGFADIPIKGSHFHWGGDVTFEVECKKFRNAGGGTIVLAESGGSAWVDQDSGSSQSNLAERFVELNKIQPEGCYFEIKDKQILYHASYLPPVRMRVIIR